MSESHHLASGFGTYAKEILTRLWDTGKYELAEFAGYGDLERCKDVPWRYYSNTPSNEQERKIYMTPIQTTHLGFGDSIM